MLIRVTVAVIMFLAGDFFALGQDVLAQDIVSDSNILQIENQKNSNVSSIKQVGYSQRVTTFQQQDGFLTNMIMISQSGEENNAYFKQTGTMQIVKSYQSGYNNEANLWQTGNLINQEIQQNGNENTINSYMKNASIFEKTAVLLQDGNYNRIDLAIFGDEIPTAYQPIKISQQGDGFVAKALMESYNFPIEITQKAGPGGGAMNVDVSVSYFSFPMK